MSQSEITYTDKIEDGGVTATGLVAADDLNDIKSTVNSNAADVASRVGTLEAADTYRQSLTVLTANGIASGAVNFADPSLASIEATLPPAGDIPNQYVTIKRIANSDHFVEILSGQMIDGWMGSRMLGNVNETYTFYSDGSNYYVVNRATNAFAAIQTTSPQLFALSYSTMKKLTTWNFNTVGTSGVLVDDSGNNRIDVIHQSGQPADGYKAKANITVEVLKDTIVSMQVRLNGVAVGEEFSVNGQGAGKPVSLAVAAIFGVTTVGSIEIWARGDANRTLTINSGSFVVEAVDV